MFGCLCLRVWECARARLQDGRELGWECYRAFQITATSSQQGPHVQNKSWHCRPDHDHSTSQL